MAGGTALQPAPQLGPSWRTGTADNSMQGLYNAELKKIYDPMTRTTMLNWRADYYAGTPAQIACTEPKGPTTDFMEGKFDPAREYNLFAVADRVLLIQSYMESSYKGLVWDYMYGLFDIDKGLGTVTGEI